MSNLASYKHTLINAGLFQAMWFAAVFQYAYIAFLFLFVMAVHAGLFSQACSRQFGLITILALLGIGFDSALSTLGIFNFGKGYVAIPFIDFPLWLACLWMGFCLTLLSSLKWLLDKPIWFVLACSIMGPVSYLAGRRFEALSFSDANILWLVAEWLSFSLIAVVLLGLRRSNHQISDKETAASSC